MSSADDRLSALSGAILDGAEIDWLDAESAAADPHERSVVQRLRTVANLYAAARATTQTWGPLQIRGEIGAGTFGVVYRAWDPMLEREVALKLSKATGLDAHHISIREARLLAQVRHANVILVHGADEFDGKTGIWTEFISGRTLKEIVETQGPFGAAETALIGRDLCRALAAVHKAGFLHRDVKAQNVMREAGGRIVLMDFGTGEPATARALSLAGTPAYLAPELLAGAEPTVLTDLYAVGVLMYFLVTGEFPVVAGSLDELRDKHARQERRRLVDLRPDLPPDFVQIVDRTVAPDPKERPQTAAEADSLLDQTIHRLHTRPERRGRLSAYLAAALIVVLGFTAALWRSLPAPTPTQPRTSVAILPFANLTTDPEDDYLSAGVTDDIAAHLARLRGLRVIAGNSVSRYKTGADAAEVGSRLNVEAVVRGSVRRSGTRLRIVSQLFDAATGEQLWSDSFDREARDLFHIQTEVSRKIATALKGELSVAETEWLAPRQGENFEAFNLYLKGRYYWSLRSEDGLQKSLHYYEDAIARFPDYARAYAGLADTFTQLGNYGLRPKAVAAEQANAAAQKAISLDPGLAEAHAALGYVQKNRFQWAQAESSFRKAIDLMPGYGPAHHWYSILLAQHGRFPEAVSESRTAISLDPLSIGTNAQLGTVLLLARRFDDAIRQYKKVLEMDPSYSLAHQVIGEAYAFKGEWRQAIESFEEARRVGAIGREDHEQLADLGMTLGRAGQLTEARGVLAELLRRRQTTPQGTAANIATVHAALGNSAEAITWLSEAMKARDSEIGYLKVDPRWDSLRGDARFATMLAELGFTPN